jgi:hypothetical protein
MSSKSKSNPNAVAGGDFEAAAARVTAIDEHPAEVSGEVGGPALMVERFEIQPEWAEAAARFPFALAARFYHPAFALSDEQARTLGPAWLPLIQKYANEWVPTWLGSAANRNPELFNAVMATTVVVFVQWQGVQRAIQAEAEAAARKEAEAAAAAKQEGEAAEALRMAA